MKKKVSICMIIKNEEENLHRSLRSLVPIIDSGLAELIIVDTGSEDLSIEIAREYTNQVYEHKWTNNFAEMRNISISYATGEWIWIMDADEEIENPEEMMTFFKKDLSKYNTISIKVKNYTNTPKDGKKSKFNISISKRGFRNVKSFRYEGAIHEQPKGIEPTIYSDITFGHYGYIWEDDDFKQKKFNRTTDILKQELKTNPNNIYYQFQLGVSTFIVDNDKGIAELKKAYRLIQKLPYKERPKYLYVYGIYGRALYVMGKYRETIKIAKEGLKFTKDYIDLWYILSRSNVNLQENEEAIQNAIEYIKCRDRFNKTSLSKDSSFTFYYLDIMAENMIRVILVSLYIKNKDIDEALNQLDKMILSDFKTDLVINIVKTTEDKQYLLDYMEKAFSNKNIKNHLITKLENDPMGKESIILAEDIISLYESNYFEKDSYYYLNLLRDSIDKNKKLKDKELEEILSLDYSELQVYYGDLIAYIVENKLNIEILRNMGRVEDVSRLANYTLEKIENFDEKIVNYLLKNKDVENIFDLKYWTTLAKVILFREEFDTEEYLNIFEEYVEKGITYIQNVYNSQILREENIYDLANIEHRFFFYMSEAKNLKGQDEVGYVRNLRKALKVFPMKKGIELLLVELEEKNQVIEEEMTLLKDKLKDNIQKLIEEGLLQEAKEMVKEYKKIAGIGTEYYSMMGVVAMIQGDIDKAEEVLKKGLSLDSNNFNLLYNLGYLYQYQEDNNLAVKYYEKAMVNASNEDEKESVYELFKDLGIEGNREDIELECRRKKSQKPKVVFLPYYEETWDSLKSLYEAFAADPNFETEVIIIPIIRNTPTGNIYVWKDYLTPKGIRNTHYEKYNFEVDKTDIVFYNNPYDGVNIPKFRSEEIKKNVGNLIYIPYFLVSATYLQKEDLQEMGQSRMCLSGHDNADIIVAGSDWEANAIQTRNSNKIIALGNPKTDFFISAQKAGVKDVPEWQGKELSEFTFMLNSHYTNVADDYNKHLHIIEYVIKSIEDNNNCSLIWRPHPLTFLMLDERTDEIANRFRILIKKAKQSKRIILDTTGSTVNSYMHADALISTSWSSIVLEALFFNIPAYVGVQNPANREDITILNATSKIKGNTLYKEDVVMSPTMPMQKLNDWDEDITNFMEDVIEGRDIKIEDRKLFIEQAYKNGDGSCGQKILQHVKRLIDKKNK